MIRSLLVIFIILYASIKVVGQKTIEIKQLDEKGNSIGFYTALNTNNFEKFMADGKGVVKLLVRDSAFIRLISVGYPDTLIFLTLADNGRSIIRNYSNSLSEVVIKSYIYSNKISNLKSPVRNKFSFFASYALSPRYTYQVGRIFTLDDGIKLIEVDLALKSKFNLDYPNLARLNIYRTGKNLDDAVNQITTSKTYYSKVPFPEELVYSGDKDGLYITYKDEKLIFRFKNQPPELDSGTYLISVELLRGTYAGISIPWSRDNYLAGLHIYPNIKKPVWFIESWESKYMNPIVNLQYLKRLE